MLVYKLTITKSPFNTLSINIVTRVLLPHLNCRPWNRYGEGAFTSNLHFFAICDVTLTSLSKYALGVCTPWLAEECIPF